MNLIQSIGPLLAQGITLSIQLSAAGENIQFTVLPSAGKENKAGITLPAQCLIGTAVELDEGLEAFFGKYAASVRRIADIAANADQQLQVIEKEAGDAAKKAIDAKRASKTPTKPGAKPGTAGKRDVSAGMIDTDEDGGSDDDDTPGGGAAATTLDTSSAAPAPAPAPAPAGLALDPSLF